MPRHMVYIWRQQKETHPPCRKLRAAPLPAGKICSRRRRHGRHHVSMLHRSLDEILGQGPGSCENSVSIRSSGPMLRRSRGFCRQFLCNSWCRFGTCHASHESRFSAPLQRHLDGLRMLAWQLRPQNYKKCLWDFDSCWPQWFKNYFFVPSFSSIVLSIFVVSGFSGSISSERSHDNFALARSPFTK